MTLKGPTKTAYNRKSRLSERRLRYSLCTRSAGKLGRDFKYQAAVVTAGRPRAAVEITSRIHNHATLGIRSVAIKCVEYCLVPPA
jgi:hypothetical protein